MKRGIEVELLNMQLTIEAQNKVLEEACKKIGELIQSIDGHFIAIDLRLAQVEAAASRIPSLIPYPLPNTYPITPAPSPVWNAPIITVTSTTEPISSAVGGV